MTARDKCSGLDPRKRAYIICTTSRSGSTLLCRMLAATGVAGAPDSHFHKPDIAAWELAHGIAPMAVSAQERRARVFAAALETGRGGGEVFGLRLMRKSFAYLSQQIDVLHPGLGGHTAGFQAVFGAIVYVHLSREDKLAQAISMVKADQSGLWHRHADGTELERTGPPRALVYDPQAIARHLSALERDDDAWVKWFADEGIAPLRLKYEDLTADPLGAVCGILAALDLDCRHADGVLPDTARLADRTSRAWAERFLNDRA